MTINIFILGQSGCVYSYSSPVVPSVGDIILFNNGRLNVTRRMFVPGNDSVSLGCTVAGKEFKIKTPIEAIPDKSHDSMMNTYFS